MKSIQTFFRLAALFLLSGMLAQAAAIHGTVTNKTDGKPSAGDTVVLVDVSAGMSAAASAKTDAKGHYTLNTPGQGPYLVRADHQGGSYFIAAPQNGGPADITVYDVAPKVNGIALDADMILIEVAGGAIRAEERFLIRNTSMPPRAQFSADTFEFTLPEDAVLDGAAATRPGGMATDTRPVPLSRKGHYAMNVPIQPNQGEKETMFQVQYHVPYNGKYTFSPRLSLPADNLVIYLPKSIHFSASTGASFQPIQQDPRVDAYVAKNVAPGQAVSFTISGEGQLPRDAQSGAGQQGEAAATDTGSAEAGNRPGGGIGNPIGTPDPLSKYKWWILAGLALLLAAGSALLLRRPAAGATAAVGAPSASVAAPASAPASPASGPAGQTAFLAFLKEELFAVESERLSGAISPAEYAEVKAGLEALMKRALKRR